MDVQTLRAEAFKALHERDGAFVIPNPWDAGSAKLLASLGFEALATTSAGLAFSLGRPDAEGAMSLDGQSIRMVNDRDGMRVADAAELQRIRTRLAMVFQHFNLWSHMQLRWKSVV